MTDHEWIEYLSGQVLALTSFCGVTAQTQLVSKSAQQKFLDAFAERCNHFESYKLPESLMAGIRQTQKELAVFFDEC
jgi:hypothetical protein